MQKLENGYWCALGRADDTMNLGGIKVSSAEIEEVLQLVPGVKEVAAIAASLGDGPSNLVIYAACSEDQSMTKDDLMFHMQHIIKRDLNPLFKIHDLVLLDALPRTASNKVIRRALRDQWDASQANRQIHGSYSPSTTAPRPATTVINPNVLAFIQSNEIRQNPTNQ